LTTSEPPVGAHWTDDCSSREVRGLKRRGQSETRSVPIPPEPIRVLWAHLDEFGSAPDGWVFYSEQGGPLQETTFARVWRRARAKAPDSRSGRLSVVPSTV
jgi:hypothetical protein